MSVTGAIFKDLVTFIDFDRLKNLVFRRANLRTIDDLKLYSEHLSKPTQLEESEIFTYKYHRFNFMYRR